MLKFSKNNSYIIFFSIIYISFGLFTFKDYGIGIEEHFQRSSGFYWLNHILQFTSLENFKEIVQSKIYLINQNILNLPDVEGVKFYGVIFDLPTAFLEVIFKIHEPQDYFYLRHLINYLIFYLSGVLFYMILKIRIKINFICFLGFCIYLLSPRMYGNSFFDGKDLFFLSIFTTTVFFYFNYEKKRNIISLFYFSLFCAFSTSTRIVGLAFPISFIFICLLKCMNEKEYASNFKTILIFVFFYILSLFLHWPYLWTLNINEYLNFFSVFKSLTETIVYFKGEFYSNKFLPISYLPLCILITTPIFIIFFYLNGAFFFLKRIFLRLINIKEHSFYNDLWRGRDEKKDLFIFMVFFQIIILYLNFKINLYGGWRVFYFLNFIISYYASLGIYIIYLKIKKKLLIKNLTFFFIFIFCLELIFKLYVYHPYQSNYFNNLTSEKTQQLFEIDTQSLSRTDAIKYIINNSKDMQNIIIGTASWTPLENVQDLLKTKDKKKLIFTGTNNLELADYIYTNHFYEVDIRYNKKYNIPSNFYLFKELKLNGTRIYSIYKNKNIN